MTASGDVLDWLRKAPKLRRGGGASAHDEEVRCAGGHAPPHPKRTGTKFHRLKPSETDTINSTHPRKGLKRRTQPKQALNDPVRHRREEALPVTRWRLLAQPLHSYPAYRELRLRQEVEVFASAS